MALRPPPQPPSQAVYTEKPPAPQAAGPGLFAGSRFSRRRQGTSTRGAPPAKRPSEAAVTQHDTQNPVDLLQRAARIMGFSLHAGPAGPVGGENPGFSPDAGSYPPVDLTLGSGAGPYGGPEPRPPPAAALGAPPGEESFQVPAPYPTEPDPESGSSYSGSVMTVEDPEVAVADLNMGDKAQALLRKYLPQFYETGRGAGGALGFPAIPCPHGIGLRHPAHGRFPGRIRPGCPGI